MSLYGFKKKKKVGVGVGSKLQKNSYVSNEKNRLNLNEYGSEIPRKIREQKRANLKFGHRESLTGKPLKSFGRCCHFKKD